jgi:hypothetical protein
MRLLSLNILFFALTLPLSAADPAPLSIDDLIAKVVADRAQVEKDKTALAKSEADLKAAATALSDRLAALGVTLGPVAPPDPLATAIQAAYTADPSVGKASDKRALALVYRQIARSMSSIDTPSVLASTIASSTKATLAGRLATITPIFGKDFATHIPAGNVALTDAQKTEIVAALTRYAAVLEGLK